MAKKPDRKKRKSAKKPAPRAEKKPSPRKLSGRDLAAGEGREQMRMSDDGSDLEEGDEADVLLEDEPDRDSQAKVAARVTGIVLRDSRRICGLSINSPTMAQKIADMCTEHREFIMKFRVPLEVSGGRMVDFEDVEFRTRILEVKIGKRATCRMTIDDRAAQAMSRLLNNWSTRENVLEFFIEGIQQEGMTECVVPIPGKYKDGSITRMLQFSAGRPYVRIRNFGWSTEWKGRPVHITTYA